MGQLIAGQWSTEDPIHHEDSGAFQRPQSLFRNQISHDHPQYHPESNRYHLYVAYACPWAQRTLIYHQLKGLAPHIGISVVHPNVLHHGWCFKPAPYQDHLYQHDHLYELYQKSQKNLTCRVTVPILWDKATQTIVNNESAEIIRIFDSAFNDLTGRQTSLYPPAHGKAIEALNAVIYQDINNGVYRCGFATSQASYDAAVQALFNRLDSLEHHLHNQDFLVGETLTEADIRLIPTLLRFDLVYYGHFKCNLKRLQDYPNLSRYLQQLYGIPAIKNTTFFDDIKQHYYYSQSTINPSRIIPIGPQITF